MDALGWLVVIGGLTYAFGGFATISIINWRSTPETPED